MTDNSTDKGGADAGPELVTLGSPDEAAALPEDLIEDDGLDEDDVPGTGAVSGGFGFAGLALAVVSLTTSWTSGVVVSHGQYSEEMKAPSSGLTAQQQLNMYENAWHTQAWWAFAFAAAAVLFGAGALLSPRILRSRGTPGWAKATAARAKQATYNRIARIATSMSCAANHGQPPGCFCGADCRRDKPACHKE